MELGRLFGSRLNQRVAVIEKIEQFSKKKKFLAQIFFFWLGRPSSRKDRVPQTIGGFTMHPKLVIIIIYYY